MIDTATGWFEIVEIPSKSSDKIDNIFEMIWLNKYPWPAQVVADGSRTQIHGQRDQSLKESLPHRPQTYYNTHSPGKRHGGTRSSNPPQHDPNASVEREK
jgi:hypothetical protein